jgi:hypothetical protein
MESVVEEALAQCLQKGAPFDYAAVQQLAQPRKTDVPQLSIPAPDLRVYDRLLGGAP